MPQFYYVLFLFFPTLGALLAAYFHRGRTFRAFSRIDSQTLPGGAGAAKLILDSEHLFDIRIERGREAHSRYVLRDKTVLLSPFDHDSRSFTALARAQHQAGHAVQHMQGHALVFLKEYLWPWIQAGGTLSLVLVPLSLFAPFLGVYFFGALLFTVYVLFAFVVFSLEVKVSRLVKTRMVELRALPEQELRLLERALEVVSLGCLVSLFFPFEKMRIRHASQS